MIENIPTPLVSLAGFLGDVSKEGPEIPCNIGFFLGAGSNGDRNSL